MCEKYELGNIMILRYKWHIFFKTAMNETMWMSMHTLECVVWNYLSLPKRQRLHRWRSGMDK